MRKFKTIVISFFISLGLSQPLLAQNVTLSGDIYEYATYYVNSFDLNSGATNVQIFRYQLSESTVFEIFDFNEDVSILMSKANICITRAGASTLAELVFLNLNT